MNHELIGRLEQLAARLAATTEHHGYAHMVIEAAEELRANEPEHQEWCDLRRPEYTGECTCSSGDRQVDDMRHALELDRQTARRDSIIEECAKVVEEFGNNGCLGCAHVAASLRVLKANSKESA
jgi:hypothetical protein